MLDAVKALLVVIVATGTAAAEPVPWGVDVVVGGAADSEIAASGRAGASAWLARGVDGQPALTVEAGVDVDRVPWLSAPRELAAAPYRAVHAGLAATGAFDAPDNPFPGDYFTFPIEMFVGKLVQGDHQRSFGGGSSTAVRHCWAHADGEPTCIGWFGGRAAAVHDDVRSFGTVALYLAPIDGLRLGPVRLDARLGMSSADRARLDADPSMPAELAITSAFWDVAVRGRAGDVDLALRTGREPYASTDGALSFEDRVSASAQLRGWSVTGYAARTRWWTMAERPPGTADTVGGEVAYAARVAGFDVLARAAAGRSFYPALDATLPELPALGARVTLDVQRTFTVR